MVLPPCLQHNSSDTLDLPFLEIGLALLSHFPLMGRTIPKGGQARCRRIILSALLAVGVRSFAIYSPGGTPFAYAIKVLGELR